MRIRYVVASLVVLTFSSAGLNAQSSRMGTFFSRTDLSVVYDYVHANDTPQPTGQATGFSLSGVSASAAYKFAPHLRAVLDIGGVHDNGVGNTGNSLTLLPYLVGPRYEVRPVFHLNPFVQVLAGGVHAYGTVYPMNANTNGSADSFAMTAGGGVDFALNHHISLRAQAEYFLTTLPNGGSNRQGNIRTAAGIVAHFGVK